MTADYSHDWSKTHQSSDNPNVLAGASDPGRPDEPEREAQTVFPVMFDKDYLDFRPQEVSEEELAPKGYYALERASEQKSLTSQTTPGLEDVSQEDLEKMNVQEPVETDS